MSFNESVVVGLSHLMSVLCCWFVVDLCCIFVLHLLFFLLLSFLLRSQDWVLLEISVVEYVSVDEGSGSGLLFVGLPTVASGFGVQGLLGVWYWVVRCVGIFLFFFLSWICFNACARSSTRLFNAVIRSFVVCILSPVCVCFSLIPSIASWSFTSSLSISSSSFSNISRWAPWVFVRCLLWIERRRCPLSIILLSLFQIGLYRSCHLVDLRAEIFGVSVVFGEYLFHACDEVWVFQ